MSDAARPVRPGEHPTGAKDHLYGGQAVIEGVMMRGGAHWAVAVRRPDGEVHVESHAIDSVARRHPILAKPFLRGVIVLGQSLAIGFRALTISARVSAPEDAQLSSGAMSASVAIAAALFIGVFIAFPAVLFGWLEHRIGSGLLANLFEGLFRVGLFLAYLWAIGRTKEIRRVFQYHGAEHKTISAFEHGDPLEPESVDRYPTLHVRCGTNFLLIVMVLTVLVFAFFGSPGIPVRIASRVVAVPVIAALAYEAIRLGARFPSSLGMRALMAPGLWLQKITTKPPNRSQIEVAIASFEEVLRREAPAPHPSEDPPPGH